MRVIAVAVIGAIWLLSDVLAAIFLATLVAVILRSLANWVAKRTRLPAPLALGGVILILAVVLGSLGYRIAPKLIDEGQALWSSLSAQLRDLRGSHGPPLDAVNPSKHLLVEHPRHPHRDLHEDRPRPDRTRHRDLGCARGQRVLFRTRWFVTDAPQRAVDVQRSIEDLFYQRLRVTNASLVHVLCWCGGGGNVWIAYHLLGAKPDIVDALAIESILSAVLAFGFLVPAGLGVQELTYVGVGRLFGIPAHLSLALSLIRRARDILIGAPALLVW